MKGSTDNQGRQFNARIFWICFIALNALIVPILVVPMFAPGALSGRFGEGVVTVSLVFMFAVIAFKIASENPKGSIVKIERELTVLQEDLKEDFFTKLVDINFKYIDKYYLQTQLQADKAFWLSVVAAMVSFVIISIGVSMMYAGKTTPAYVTAGAGAFGEFIAAVFFYLYNRTVLKMGEYHQKLVLTQNVSLALKVAEGLSDDAKGKAQAQIIESLTKDINLHLSQSASNAKG